MNLNSIDYISIIAAISELTKIGNNPIVTRLQNILNTCEISKPKLHNRKDDKSTSYYTVELSEEELDEIKAVFLGLEAGSLNEDGESTGKTDYYATLLDNWTNISGNDHAKIS